MAQYTRKLIKKKKRSKKIIIKKARLNLGKFIPKSRGFADGSLLFSISLQEIYIFSLFI